MIIGRQREIEALNECYESDEAELVALYGRRRVGKTYLVDQVFNDRITFRHSGLSPLDGTDETDMQQKSRLKKQMKHFHRSLTAYGLQDVPIPETWMDAFYLLEDLLQQLDDCGTRQLVFLDEIQWMDTPKSGFMMGLEAFWNGWACHRSNIMVIVCGSSSSWVLDKLIDNHGGLYGRVTREIFLMPFSLHECELFFKSKGVVMSRYDITQAYMMLGGIPYYLKYFKKTQSLPQNIDMLFFQEHSPLKNEFDRLFSSLFSNPEMMKSIVTVLATRRNGFSRGQLLQKIGLQDSGEFSSHLRALISGMFISKYRSFGSNTPEVYYKLTDPFCNFYLKFVKGQEGTVHWENITDTAPVNVWRGYAFENVCFNHIPQIKKALGISGVATSESLWSKRGTEEQGTQVDLILKRKDNIYNMCEAKFYSDLFAVSREYHFTLVRRRNLLMEKIPKKATVHNILITTYGLERNEYFSDFIQTVTLDDLFTDG